MRNRMTKELGTAKDSSAFNLKQDSGGLIDIEFIVQYMVLAWACKYEDLAEFSDNMRILDAIERNQLLSNEQINALKEIYILYRSRLHRLALQNSDNMIAGGEYREERATVSAIWESLFAAAGMEEK